MLPIVAFIGKSDSGKTTFLEKVIEELTGRGYRVATAKRHAHEGDLDVPGKDSWRHARAGAAVAMVSSAKQVSVVSSVDRQRTLEELAEIADRSGEVDILLAEGFKAVAPVRIEISRDARSTDLVSEPDGLVALVTDGKRDVADVPVFGLEDASGVADLIEREYLVCDDTRLHDDRRSRSMGGV